MSRAAHGVFAPLARAAAVCVALASAGCPSGAGCSGGPGKPQPPRFVPVAPGIEHARFEAKPREAESFSGHAFRVDLDHADLQLVPAGSDSSRRSVAQIASEHPSVLAVNASFFDEEGRAMGLGVDRGRLIALHKQPHWGALLLDDDGDEGPRARIVKGSEIVDDLAHRLVVQGIPRLVIDGEVQKLKPQVAERTAICADGDVVVLVVSTKADTTAFARFLAAPPQKGGLGCEDALNLDGGPSTQLYVRLPGLQLSQPGGWGVPNALVAVPKPPSSAKP